MMRRSEWFVASAAVIAFLAASGCGGGSSPGTGLVPTPPTPSAPSSSNSTAVTLQAQSTSVPLPPVQSYSGTITMPPGMGSVTITSGMQPPAGVSAPSGFSPMMYVWFTATGGSVTMDETPGFDMDMMSSSMMGSSSYYMAQYLNGAWTTVEGPAMMNGTSMMMDGPAEPISLQDGQLVCFAYYTGALVGSPSPSPSMMP